MTEAGLEQFDLNDVVVRQANEADVPSLRHIFQQGVIEGQVPNNDTGADIDNLQEGYFSDEDNSAFWVATWREEVVAMIGVQRAAPDCAEIRRLRVKSIYRRHGVGTLLLEHALNFCQAHNYLKVILDVRIERDPAIKMFEKFGFVLSRTRELDGRKMLDFYVDLYRERNF